MSASPTPRLQATAALSEPVETLRYAGGKRLQALHSLGLRSIADLLGHYPFRYNDFTRIKAVRALRSEEKAVVAARVDEVRVKQVRTRATQREMPVVEAYVTDGSGVMVASWFNQPWVADKLKQGTALLLLGQIEHFAGFPRMSSPLYRVLADKDFAEYEASGRSAAAAREMGAQIEPVYPALANLSSNWISKLVSEALEQTAGQLDPLPPSLRMSRGLMPRHAALRAMHGPLSREDYRAARRRLAYEEVFYAQVALMRGRLREEAGAVPCAHVTSGPLLSGIAGKLPFELTCDQAAAVRDILAAMAAPSLMNCLLLGDVGSGKTAVALHAVAAAVDSGRQAAMIAPTTVLAEQYAVKLGPLLDSQGVSWALLTGSCKPSQREEASAGLANGSISVAFGTHALLEQDVSFASLSLAVIDEQHRFGVEQRERIRTKSRGLDVLMMSATPIPRSLAMVVYGDMSTVYLRSKPNAAKVQTRILHHELLFEAYDAIRQAMAAGQQAYIICPLIEPGGKAAQKGGKGKGEGAPDEQQKESDIVSLYSEFDDSPHIAAAVEEVRMLGEQVFSDRRVELMTSRLSDAEKHDVMQAFRAGETDILVSTTVVEVGIDVPNATVMVIMDADRFGLAQLHQLRGRVGRGRSDGQVFLVTQNKEPDALARLRALEATSDGLELAQMDLRLRREGDILGTRQHGRGALKLVNVVRDAALIEAAHEDAAALLEADPELALPAHRFLASECARMLQEAD